MTGPAETRPPRPPFTAASAVRKVRAAEDGWNSRCARSRTTWFRSFGNENWQFDGHGLMTMRHASINDLPIRAEERKFHWPLGRRPEEHPGLSSFGF